MELNQLRCFLHVAQTQHITRSAEQLHITQPALSKVISRLEADLGVKLFEREGKHIYLNEAGKAAVAYIERALQTLGDMQTHLADYAGGQQGHITIATSYPSRTPDWLLECLTGFMRTHPAVSVSQQQMNPIQLQNALEARQIDIAISTTPIESPNIRWEQLFTERLGVIMSRGNPLAEKPVLSMGDLADQKFLCNNANSDVHHLTYTFCGRAGFVPQIYYEGDFPELIGQAISRGTGVSFIAEPRHQKQSGRPDAQDWEHNIVFRPVDAEYCKRDCGLATLKNRYMPRAFTELHSHLRLHYLREAPVRATAP